MSKVLIVGGSSGIGLATAELFSKNQHEVVSISRNTTPSLDFANETAVKAFFESHTDFDYVIVTATMPLAMGSFLSINLKDAKTFFDKFWGIAYVIRYAAEYSKHLKAISVVSGAAADKRGAPFTFLATNGVAIHALIESLAVELAPLRINAISPGLTRTPLYGETPRETLQEWADASPLKRLASADEIAEVIHFVTVHPQMTGAIIAVDAGARLV